MTGHNSLLISREDKSSGSGWRNPRTRSWITLFSRWPWVRRSLLTWGEERHDSEVKFPVQEDKGNTGGGVVSGNWWGRGWQGGTKGQVTQVCHQGLLLRATGRVRGETSGVRVFSGERKPTTTDWKCPTFTCRHCMQSG